MEEGNMMERRCHPMIMELIRIKRGEYNNDAAIESLEELKNDIDSFITELDFNRVVEGVCRR